MTNRFPLRLFYNLGINFAQYSRVLVKRSGEKDARYK